MLLLNFHMRFLLIFSSFLFNIYKFCLIRRCLNVSGFDWLNSKLRLPFWLGRIFLLLSAVWLSELISFSKRWMNATINCSDSYSIWRLNRTICKLKLMLSDQITCLFDNTQEVRDSSIVENYFIQIFKLILLEILDFWVISFWKNIEKCFTYLILDIDR